MHATPLTDVDIKCAWNVVPVDINGRIIFIILLFIPLVASPYTETAL